MARFSRLEVLNTIVDLGLVPVFYHPDLETAKKIAEALAAGGARVLEFTNRGDFAPWVFKDLAEYLAKTNPHIILGVGSVVDAPTAALYIASGANFVELFLDVSFVVGGHYFLSSSQFKITLPELPLRMASKPSWKSL